MHIARQLREILDEERPLLTIIEEYAYSAKGRGVSVMYEIGVCSRCQLIDRGKPWSQVTPGQLKTWAGASGGGDKAAVADAAREKFGFHHKSDDVVDAFVLADMARAFMLDELPPSLHNYIKKNRSR